MVRGQEKVVSSRNTSCLLEGVHLVPSGHWDVTPERRSLPIYTQRHEERRGITGWDWQVGVARQLGHERSPRLCRNVHLRDHASPVSCRAYVEQMKGETQRGRNYREKR